jgi:23S rRNA (guanosine2251-2'-O)-methyltransferase
MRTKSSGNPPRRVQRAAESGDGARAASGTVAGEAIYGIEPLREILAVQPEAIEVLYLRERDTRRFADEIERVKQAGGRVVQVDDAELTRAAGSEEARHQGLVATVRPYRYLELAELVDQVPDLIVLVDGVTDPRNLGAILRVTECAGFKSVILARDRTASLTPAAIKTSAGAWVHLRIAQCGNVVRTLEDLKEKGYWIAALTPEGDTSIYQLDVRSRLVLVIGAEGEGVRALVKKRADFRVKIPLYGKLESLNVSVATAVALFEIKRRREGLFQALSNVL